MNSSVWIYHFFYSILMLCIVLRYTSKAKYLAGAVQKKSDVAYMHVL